MSESIIFVISFCQLTKCIKRCLRRINDTSILIWLNNWSLPPHIYLRSCCCCDILCLKNHKVPPTLRRHSSPYQNLMLLILFTISTLSVKFFFFLLRLSVQVFPKYVKKWISNLNNPFYGPLSRVEKSWKNRHRIVFQIEFKNYHHLNI